MLASMYANRVLLLEVEITFSVLRSYEIAEHPFHVSRRSRFGL
jgi:hypothetical protein